MSDRNPYVAVSDQTRGAYALLEVVVTPGGGPPPHKHLLEDEGFYVLEGDFTVWVEGKNPVKLGVGQHAFGPRNVVHHFRNVGTTPGRLLLIFTPGGCERYFQELAAIRELGGDDLLEREEEIDKGYGIVIDRRAPRTD